MNLFQYVTLMKQSESPVAIVGVALLSLFLVVILLKMLGGMRRGTMRQLVRTGMTLAAAVVSYIAADTVTGSIIGSIKAETIEELIASISATDPQAGAAVGNVLRSLDPELFESVILLPTAIVLAPLLATIIFLLLNTILKIVRAIIIKIFKFKKSKSNPERLGGALLGAVQGIIWISMICLPFNALLSLVDNAYTNVSNSPTADIKEIKPIYEEYIEPLTENPAFTFINNLGTEKACNSIATVKIKGHKVNLREETVSVATIILSEAPKLSEMNPSELTRANKEAITNIVNGLCESTYTSNLLVCGLKSIAAIMDLDMLPIDTEGDFSELVDGLFEYLNSISIDTLLEDANTVKAIYFTLSDSGILKALSEGGSDIFAQLQESQKNGDNVIKSIITILQSNERTAKLVKALTASVINSISSSIELEDGTVVEISYDTLKDGLTNVLDVKEDQYDSKEEYMDALKETIGGEFSNLGVDLEEEVLEDVAEYFDENLSDKLELSDEDFSDIILNYYESYLNYLETGNIPEDLPDNLPEDIFQ